MVNLEPGSRLGSYESSRCSGAAGWVRSGRPATRDSIASSPSSAWNRSTPHDASAKRAVAALKGPMATADAVRLALEIAGALETAHERHPATAHAGSVSFASIAAW